MARRDTEQKCRASSGPVIGYPLDRLPLAGWLSAEILAARTISRASPWCLSKRGSSPQDVAPKDRSYSEVDGEARQRYCNGAASNWFSFGARLEKHL
jgi:hypothetical protein